MLNSSPETYKNQVLSYFMQMTDLKGLDQYTSFEEGGGRKPISKTERKKRNKKNKQASKQRKRNGKK